MKQTGLLSFLLLISYFLPVPAQNTRETVRISEPLNFGWKFQRGNIEDAHSVIYDDSNWRNLDIPHDFQIEQPWDQSAGGGRGFKAMGEGWYRKTFKANKAWKGKKILLDFEGIMLNGEVWFNGRKMADIEYGYLGREVDITPHIDFEGNNLVAVFATTKGNSRWYTGGGLYRDVYLLVKDSISVARHGVFITTPVVSEQQAEISVQVELEGITNKSLDIEIIARIISPNGEQVAEVKTFAPKKNKLKTVEILLPAISVDSPQLWSCDTPNLYEAEVLLVYNGKTIDRVTETFGIRTIEFSPEFGLKLNGEKVFLKGIANHHDLGPLGAAVYDRAIERLFLQLKAFGFNHIRTSHNPYSESFLQLADKHGILVVDELCDKWGDRDYWPGSKPFSTIWYKMIPEWIKRDRNHPSVIMWSLGNELQMREDLAGFPTGDWGVTSYKILDLLAKRYDPTRKTTVAMFPSRANAITRHDTDFHTNFTPPELSLVTDIASYNYQYQAYGQYLKQAPNLIVYQSEATTNDLLRPFYGMDHDKMVGLAYWGAVEYWGESNEWPKKGWNFSFFDHALQPYPEAYLIKSAFSDEPLVHIAVIDSERESFEWNDIVVGKIPVSSHWNRKEGSLQNLFTYTNAEEVELLVNGKSLGIQKNETSDPSRRNMIYWQDIPYQKGKITAVARSNGKEIARHQLETTGPATALKIEIETADWKADGMDLQYVKIYAIHNKGRKVRTTTGEVLFDVSGAARLLAVDNGDHYTDNLFTGNKIPLHSGFAIAILRSEQFTGKITVKAEVKGLKNIQKDIETK